RERRLAGAGIARNWPLWMDARAPKEPRPASIMRLVNDDRTEYQEDRCFSEKVGERSHGTGALQPSHPGPRYDVYRHPHQLEEIAFGFEQSRDRNTVAWPEIGASKPSNNFTAVVFPAPLGPSEATSWPGSTARS